VNSEHHLSWEVVEVEGIGYAWVGTQGKEEKVVKSQVKCNNISR